MEAEAFLATMKDLRLPDGRGRVVRHGQSTQCGQKHGPNDSIR
jgi:hypothetical protein